MTSVFIIMIIVFLDELENKCLPCHTLGGGEWFSFIFWGSESVIKGKKEVSKRNVQLRLKFMLENI